MLERAYQSVSKQTFTDWELLIVDDGSTDGTEELVKQWQEIDSRIFFYKRPNDRAKGASTCRNIGIELARGSFIAFLDSDDEWLDRRLEDSIQFIRAHNASAIYSGAEVKGRNSSYFRPSRAISKGEALFDFLLKNDSFIPTPSLVLDATIAKKVKFNENLRIHEDYEFIIKVGDLVSWIFFDNTGVIIHWEQNRSKQIDYQSCLWFYEQYSQRSNDPLAKYRYLIYMVEDMIQKSPPYPFLDRYYSILKNEGFSLNRRLKLLFATPYVFHVLLRIRKIIKSK